MSAEQSKAAVRHFMEESFGGGKLEMVDDLLAPDFVRYDPYIEAGEVRGTQTLLTCMLLIHGGDQIGIGMGALGSEVYAVPKVFGMAGTRTVPVDQHCPAWVSPYPIDQHFVVWHPAVAVWDRDIHHQDLAHTREHPHHLLELLGSEDAVVAYVDDHYVAELAGGMKLPEDANGFRCLATATRIDDGQIRYLVLERVDGA